MYVSVAAEDPIASIRACLLLRAVNLFAEWRAHGRGTACWVEGSLLTTRLLQCLGTHLHSVYTVYSPPLQVPPSDWNDLFLSAGIVCRCSSFECLLLSLKNPLLHISGPEFFLHEYLRVLLLVQFGAFTRSPASNLNSARSTTDGAAGFSVRPHHRSSPCRLQVTHRHRSVSDYLPYNEPHNQPLLAGGGLFGGE